MTARQEYRDIMNGVEYNLPGSVSNNDFREGVYDTDQAAATGTTSRIRALLYVCQDESLDEIPNTST